MLRMPGDRLATSTVSYYSNSVDSLIVAGTKGSIHMSPAFGFCEGIEQNRTVGEKKAHEAFKAIDQFGGELRYFSDCILNDRDPEHDTEEGLADLRVIEGAARALETGERQVLEPIERSRRIDPTAQKQTLSAVEPVASIKHLIVGRPNGELPGAPSPTAAGRAALIAQHPWRWRHRRLGRRA